MFYNQLTELCRYRNIKPTQLAKLLGFSPSNFKRWEEGGAVNSDILLKLAKYFNVPMDYFFNEDNEPYDADTDGMIKAFQISFNAIKSHFDYFVSILTGCKISSRDLSIIAEYMGQQKDFFVLNDNVIANDEPNLVRRSAITIISDILNRLAGTKEYRYLQVQISRRILYNLEGKKIYKDNLLKAGLLNSKIEKLFDPNISSEKKKGLNFSDLNNIAWKCNLTLEYMLTGKEETVEQQNAT